MTGEAAGASGLEDRKIPPCRVRRRQRFLDRHLHAARDPSGTWTDFPPLRLRDLAALPSPLGPIVTAPG